MISHAVQDHLRTIIEQLSLFATHRLENYRVSFIFSSFILGILAIVPKMNSLSNFYAKFLENLHSWILCVINEVLVFG